MSGRRTSVSSSPGSPVFRFNLHGLVRGEVRGPEWLVAPVRHELSFHQVHEAAGSEPDLIVRLGYSRGMTKKPASVLHDWQGRHLIARWRAGMSEARTPPVQLVFQGDRASRFIVSKWIVEPAVRVTAQKKGALMVHASALSDGERAVLVAGEGGTGKTTWVLHWLSKNHPHLSDDFALFHDNYLLPYVTPLRLGLKNLMVNPVLKNIGLTNKFNIAFRTLIRRMSLGIAKFYFKAPIQTAVPGVKISKGVELIGAIILNKSKKPEGAKSGEITPHEYARILTDIDRKEMHGFAGPRLDQIACTPGPGFWSYHHDLVVKALAGKPCYLVPARSLPPAEAVRSISELLNWASRGRA